MDKNIVPNAAISDKLWVISLSTAQTDRLLKDTPLKVGGVLASTDHPLAVAACFNFTELFGVLTPWVNYAFEQIPEQQMAGQKELVLSQVAR